MERVLMERDLLKLDLLGAINTLGTGDVLSVVSESLRATGGQRFSDWDKDLQRLADALEVLAERAREFEAWYGDREP